MLKSTVLKLIVVAALGVVAKPSSGSATAAACDVPIFVFPGCDHRSHYENVLTCNMACPAATWYYCSNDGFLYCSVVDI
jgi:hypothetical protein